MTTHANRPKENGLFQDRRDALGDISTTFIPSKCEPFDLTLLPPETDCLHAACVALAETTADEADYWGMYDSTSDDSLSSGDLEEAPRPPTRTPAIRHGGVKCACKRPAARDVKVTDINILPFHSDYSPPHIAASEDNLLYRGRAVQWLRFNSHTEGGNEMRTRLQHECEYFCSLAQHRGLPADVRRTLLSGRMFTGEKLEEKRAPETGYFLRAPAAYCTPESAQRLLNFRRNELWPQIRNFGMLDIEDELLPYAVQTFFPEISVHEPTSQRLRYDVNVWSPRK